MRAYIIRAYLLKSLGLVILSLNAKFIHAFGNVLVIFGESFCLLSMSIFEDEHPMRFKLVHAICTSQKSGDGVQLIVYEGKICVPKQKLSAMFATPDPRSPMLLKPHRKHALAACAGLLAAACMPDVASDLHPSICSDAIEAPVGEIVEP